MTVRLNKYLADAGVASRRQSELLIADGRVCVNGVLALTPAIQISSTDIVTLDGTPISVADSHRLWLYYKPVGLVCSHADEQGRETVFDALPDSLGRVISVGRLDLNSEGLLLLTNSGDVARLLEHPSTRLKRIYRVRLFGIPSEDALRQIRAGITIDGMEYRPAEVEVERAGNNSWVRITLSEGKNREIRRIFEYFGHPVSRLIRTHYGEFTLGTLVMGEVKEVSDAAARLALLFSSSKGQL
jgi:23S rRNA pseudouridine2605 synthase